MSGIQITKIPVRQDEVKKIAGTPDVPALYVQPQNGIVNLPRVTYNPHNMLDPHGSDVRGANINQRVLSIQYMHDRIMEHVVLLDDAQYTWFRDLGGQVGETRITQSKGADAVRELVEHDALTQNQSMFVRPFATVANDIAHNTLAKTGNVKSNTDLITPNDSVIFPHVVGQQQQQTGDETSMQQHFVERDTPNMLLIRATQDDDVVPVQFQPSVPPAPSVPLFGGPPLASGPFGLPMPSFISTLASPPPPPSVQIIQSGVVYRTGNAPQMKVPSFVADPQQEVISTGQNVVFLDDRNRSVNPTMPRLMMPHPPPPPGSQPRAMMLDNTQNVQVGGENVYNIQDGGVMAARMMNKKAGTTDADFKFWSTLYNEGRGVTVPPARDTCTNRAQQRRALISPVRDLSTQLADQGVQPQHVGWRMLPEHLGMMFIKPEISSAINVAAWQVHYQWVSKLNNPSSQAQRERVPVIDLITHEMTSVPFMILVAAHVKRARAERDMSRVNAKDLVTLFDKDILDSLTTLAQLHYRIPGGFLALAGHYNPQAYLDRIALQASRAAFTAQNGRHYTDVPSMLSPFATASAPSHSMLYASDDSKTQALYQVSRAAFGNPILGGAQLSLEEMDEMRARQQLLQSIKL